MPGEVSLIVHFFQMSDSTAGDEGRNVDYTRIDREEVTEATPTRRNWASKGDRRFPPARRFLASIFAPFPGWFGISHPVSR